MLKHEMRYLRARARITDAQIRSLVQRHGCDFETIKTKLGLRKNDDSFDDKIKRQLAHSADNSGR